MKTLYEQLYVDQSIEYLLKNVPYFRIDNVVEYLSETYADDMLSVSDLPGVRPPFNRLFMEFNDHDIMPILVDKSACTRRYH